MKTVSYTDPSYLLGALLMIVGVLVPLYIMRSRPIKSSRRD